MISFCRNKRQLCRHFIGDSHIIKHNRKLLIYLFGRFASNPKALLLATDVAARGLDIPDVQHVIHYQMPRTSEVLIIIIIL